MYSHVLGNKSVAISLQWKIGIDAKDWDSIARKEKIQVHNDITLLPVPISVPLLESTNEAVAWFSMMSLSICIMSAAVQILYSKRYFRKKNLI
uniref:GOLD domain-containing protein n=1 Tax=Solanum lycopersicum TaxID=4081 RepID=K4C6M3_SOLLC